MILDYLGGHNEMTRVLKSGRERKNQKPELCDGEGLPLIPIPGFEDGGKGPCSK